MVVVANRLPVDQVTDPDGSTRWQRSPGGLVTALEPFVAGRGGAWVGWSGSAGDAPEPFESGGMSLVPVALTEDEVDRYYEGMSNASLWPLYHDVVEKPEYHRAWWDTYVQVNKRFAERAAAVAAENAIVWVHDYQLQLVPALLRQQRPDLTIGFFLHIPFPPYELFTQLPWRSAIVEGLLGADLVGFPAPRRGVELRPARPPAARPAGPRPRRRVRRPDRRRARLPDLHRRRRVRRAGPLPRGAGRGPRRSARSSATRPRSSSASTGSTTPRASASGWPRSRNCSRTARSRPRTPSWSRWRRRAANASSTTCTCARQIEQQVGHINGVFGSMAGPAVHYFNQSMPREELAALYRAADVMLVTPYRDGMNLVAKEYVAARGDLGGALVLSEFAGAAAELKQAFLVNPHDIAGVKSQLVRALRMDAAEGGQADAGDAPAPGQERPRPLGELLLRRAARSGRRPADRPDGRPGRRRRCRAARGGAQG